MFISLGQLHRCAHLIFTCVHLVTGSSVTIYYHASLYHSGFQGPVLKWPKMPDVAFYIFVAGGGEIPFLLIKTEEYFEYRVITEKESYKEHGK